MDRLTAWSTLAYAIMFGIYLIVFIGTAILLLLQLREYRRQRESSLLDSVYHRLSDTQKARNNIGANRILILDSKTLDDLSVQDKDLRENINDVINCYQYIGLLVDQKSFKEYRMAILNETSAAALAIDDIIHHLVKEEDRKRPGYKIYYTNFIDYVRRAR
jgi:predicted GTPase